MATWDDLAQELDAWQASNRRASFWWRDDDAVRVTPALERLLALSDEAETPVSLAVIPRDADDELRDRLARHPLSNVLQHGWSHANHAPEGRHEEFGPHRPLPAMLDELARGWRRIAGFAHSFPVFVAPWNRMNPHVLSYLGAAGLRAVSTLGREHRPRHALECGKPTFMSTSLIGEVHEVSSACSWRWSKLSRTFGSAAWKRWTPRSRPA